MAGGGAAGGFVTRSFEAMLKECSSAPRKLQQPLQSALRTYLDNVSKVNQEPPPDQKSHTATMAVEGSISDINEHRDGFGSNPVDNIEPIAVVLASAGHILQENQAELVLQPLRLAFETKYVKLVELALDCIHKLIAYDHLEGDPGLEGGKNAPLFTDILNMVFDCVDNSSTDSTILQVVKVLLSAVASDKFRVHGELLLSVISVCYNIALNSKSLVNQATSKAMLAQMVSIVIKRMESDQALAPSLNAASSSNISSLDKSENGEISVDDHKNKKITLEDALSLSNISDTSTSIEELQSLASGADMKGLEAVLDKVVQIEDGRRVQRGLDLDSMNITQRDALLLFRTLCKMSMKDESDEVAIKTRLLSLELLQGLLEGLGGSFSYNMHFIDSVKAYLSYALLQAAVSLSPVLFQYACGILSVLLLRFRESLKGEIGFFFPLVILRSLDSSECPLGHRASVLRMLEKVCKDSQMLVDLYFNFDCNLDGPNLFQRMVNVLSKIAQGTINSDPNSDITSQSFSIKGSSLQCLFSILNSIIEWEKLRRDQLQQASASKVLENASMNHSTDDSQAEDEDHTQFEIAESRKSTMEAAISEFKLSPDKAIKYLLSNKLLENSASSVAQFLKSSPRLDKVMIGEYLGQQEEFPLAVMHSYVDTMNFSGYKFDAAIREFLKGFRLPGEAQKIDRIMEKFAERYCTDNPGLFKNADAAYVLAYTVIILNTDAHNPKVWPKMSKLDFIRMTTANDAKECAPTELLEEIYDSIVNEEIKMNGNDADPTNGRRQRPEAEEKNRIVNILNLALPRRPETDSKAESEKIIRQTQAFFGNQVFKHNVFHVAQQVELVRPMLEVVGWPLLATFSVTMEEDDSKPRVVLCMEGFRAAIYLARVLGMDTMRYAFLTSLVRFTYLHARKDIRHKNVEAIRTLLSLADAETDSVQDTWNAVLECVSRLDYITSNPSIAATIMLGSNQTSRDAVIQSLKELSGKPSEQIFVNSVKLPSDAIVQLFTALCGVSAEELKQTPPRVFSLQKLVEISYYNMSRIRLVWARIWYVLAQHFIVAGSHHEDTVATYAIDSLRQLSMKYLERTELNNFFFQNDILKPFVVLMRNSRNEKIRGLIVGCIVQLVKSKGSSIKSGWRSVFMIFTAATDDDAISIVESAFENLEQVILEHFDQVIGDCFTDCVRCLIRFANNKASPRISLKAIALLRIFIDRLPEGFIPAGGVAPMDVNLKANIDVSEQYWLPMLAGLSDLTLDSRQEVCNCALEVLFDLLNERGHKFSSLLWENIFRRVLFPIFDHVRHAGGDGHLSSGDDWLRETIIHSLQLICNLFSTFYKEVSFMFPSLLALLLDCAKRSDQTVVSIALGALVHLIEVGGHRFNEGDWETLLQSIRDVSYTTQPLELLNFVGYQKTLNQQLRTNESAGNIEVKTVYDNVSYGHDEKLGRKSGSLSAQYDEDADLSIKVEDSGGPPSPSGRSQKPTEDIDTFRSQTFAQRFMGNMMDNLLLRSFTSKSKGHLEDVTPSSSEKISSSDGPTVIEEENPLLETIRSKCVTQLLLLGAIDSIQVRYWDKLKDSQKLEVMDVLLSLLEFAASYNSPSNIRLRMNHTPSERLPLNLLRQELSGTSVYLEILNKSALLNDANGSLAVNTDTVASSETSLKREKLGSLSEEKLVSFCVQVLRDACNLQASAKASPSADAHRVLDLRAPVIVKVLNGMCRMDQHIFKKHLNEFYPLITRLICCDQMDVRGALGDLMSVQLTGLVS